MQPSSSSRRSRSWGSGPWTTPATTPPLSPSPMQMQMKPRHERSRSTTSTYSPLVASQSHSHSHSQQVQANADGSVTEPQEVVVLPPEDSVRPPPPPTTMETESPPPTTMETESPPRVSDNGGAAASKERVRLLEREVSLSKQREMKMLESLVQLTQELEQAKIALEEAKLELATLRQQQQGSGAATGPSTTTQHPTPPQQQWSVMDLMFGGVDEELNGLRSKLRSAQQGEERSRKAADELAAALSAVTMEAKQVKAWLSDAEAELRPATDRAAKLAAGWKDAAAAWRAREKALLARARAAEADLAGERQALEDDNAALRRALEQAVEEANAAGEALEAAGEEHAGRLREAAEERERDVEALRRENEGLKASEAAARDRADELQRQLDAAAAAAAAAAKEEERREEKGIPLVEKWRREDAEGKIKLGGAAFLGTTGGRLVTAAGRNKERMFASLSNLAELKSAAAAAAAMDDYGYEFDHLDVVGQYGVEDDDGGVNKHGSRVKRRSMLRKFGDLFRRRSLYKPNLAPVQLHNHY